MYGKGLKRNSLCISSVNILNGNMVPDSKPASMFLTAETPHISVSQNDKKPIINAMHEFNKKAMHRVSKNNGMLDILKLIPKKSCPIANIGKRIINSFINPSIKFLINMSATKFIGFSSFCPNFKDFI